MIRIENSTYWLYSVKGIKEKASAKVRYFLRGVKEGSDLNTDLLIKEIDKDIIFDTLEEVALDLFNFALRRHSKELDDCFRIGEVLPEGEEHVEFITNIFLAESLTKLQYVDISMEKALIAGLCFMWMNENGYGPGINKFGIDYEGARVKLLTTTLELRTRERNTNPIY